MRSYLSSSRRRFLAAAVGVGAAGVAGCLGAPGLDNAAYSTAGDTVPELDYEDVQRRGREAGYDVEGPYYVNDRERIGRPLEVPALAEQFGDDARVVLTQFRYSATRFFEVDFTGPTGMRLVCFDDELAFERPFRPTNLPPDDWLREQFALLFDLDDAEAQTLVEDVKAAAADTDDHFVTHTVDRDPDLTAVHAAFEERATETTVSETGGDGWANVVFADDDGEFGRFSVVVPSVWIRTRDSGHRYGIKIDRLGGLRLLVLLPPGETIPESEYRGVFRELFETLGLPADRVDGYEFTYTPSNW